MGREKGQLKNRIRAPLLSACQRIRTVSLFPSFKVPLVLL